MRSHLRELEGRDVEPSAGIIDSQSVKTTEQGGINYFIGCAIEIVKRSDHSCRFKILPRRWAVELTFAWLGRYRRLSKDYEYNPQTSETMISTAMTHLMLRRLARHHRCSSA